MEFEEGFKILTLDDLVSVCSRQVHIDDTEYPLVFLAENHPDLLVDVIGSRYKIAEQEVWDDNNHKEDSFINNLITHFLVRDYHEVAISIANAFGLETYYPCRDFAEAHPFDFMLFIDNDNSFYSMSTAMEQLPKDVSGHSNDVLDAYRTLLERKSCENAGLLLDYILAQVSDRGLTGDMSELLINMADTLDERYANRWSDDVFVKMATAVEEIDFELATYIGSHVSGCKAKEELVKRWEDKLESAAKVNTYGEILSLAANLIGMVEDKHNVNLPKPHIVEANGNYAFIRYHLFAGSFAR